MTQRQDRESGHARAGRTVQSDGAGSGNAEQEDDVVAELAGSMTGVFEPGYLDDLRNEWDGRWD